MLKKIAFTLLLLFIIASAIGCSGKNRTKAAVTSTRSETEIASSSPTSSGLTASDIFDQNAIQTEMMKAANAYRDIYKSIDTKKYFNVVASETQRQQIVDRIGSLGYLVVSENINMQNPGAVKQFWESAKTGKDAELAIYEVESDASLSGVH